METTGATLSSATQITAWTSDLAVESSGTVHTVFMQYDYYESTRRQRYRLVHAERPVGGAWKLESIYEDAQYQSQPGRAQLLADAAGGLHVVFSARKFFYLYRAPGQSTWSSIQLGDQTKALDRPLFVDPNGVVHVLHFDYVISTDSEVARHSYKPLAGASFVTEDLMPLPGSVGFHPGSVIGQVEGQLAVAFAVDGPPRKLVLGKRGESSWTFQDVFEGFSNHGLFLSMDGSLEMAYEDLDDGQSLAHRAPDGTVSQTKLCAYSSPRALRVATGQDGARHVVSSDPSFRYFRVSKAGQVSDFARYGGGFVDVDLDMVLDASDGVHVAYSIDTKHWYGHCP